MIQVAPEQAIAIDHILPNPDNPRFEAGDVTELVAQIAAVGLLHPLLVKPHPTREGFYLIEAGERRWTACRHLGYEEIPCRVQTNVPTDAAGATASTLINGLVENTGRPLTPMERANAYGKLRKPVKDGGCGMTLTQIAKATGVNIATVDRYLLILETDAKTQERVRTGKITVDQVVTAVRSTRAKNRKRQGKAPISVGWEPDHFADTHALARKASVMCSARGHSMRRRFGKKFPACGSCYEVVIRQDQDVVRGVAQTALAVPFIPSPEALHETLEHAGKNGMK